MPPSTVQTVVDRDRARLERTGKQGIDRILSLPMFPEITPEQQSRAVDVLKRAVG